MATQSARSDQPYFSLAQGIALRVIQSPDPASRIKLAHDIETLGRTFQSTHDKTISTHKEVISLNTELVGRLREATRYGTGPELVAKNQILSEKINELSTERDVLLKKIADQEATTRSLKDQIGALEEVYRSADVKISYLTEIEHDLQTTRRELEEARFALSGVQLSNEPDITYGNFSDGDDEFIESNGEERA